MTSPAAASSRAAAFRFVPGPIFSQVVLVDEINRATPRTQAALLEAMQERQVSVDGVTRPLPEPFIVLATQNPIELEGTFALPEAQLDRFLLRIAMGYPSAASSTPSPAATRPRPSRSTRVMRSSTAETCLRAPRVRPTGPRRGRGRGLPRQPWCGPRVSTPTSGWEHRPAAASPCTAPAQAGPRSRGGTTRCPTTSAAVAHAVLDHRILLDLDRELRGATMESVVDAVLDEVPVPLAE